MTLHHDATAVDLASPSYRPPPRNRMVVAVLSLVGLFVALYLLAYSAGLIPLICGVGSCETVQASEWAKVGPIQVPLIGVFGYVSLLGVALYGLQPVHADERGPGLILFALAAIGVAYSGFLTYLEARVINAWCMWCITSATLMVLVFLASLPELFRPGASS
ncbi:MAG: vitamin K epoxide reductase family protein [Gemmatimonadetes bacterium]|nr:vitamin K epoxide reductase family protein [Gemmatimonadota bacterium]